MYDSARGEREEEAKRRRRGGEEEAIARTRASRGKQRERGEPRIGEQREQYREYARGDVDDT